LHLNSRRSEAISNVKLMRQSSANAPHLVIAFMLRNSFSPSAWFKNQGWPLALAAENSVQLLCLPVLALHLLLVLQIHLLSLGLNRMVRPGILPSSILGICCSHFDLKAYFVL